MLDSKLYIAMKKNALILATLSVAFVCACSREEIQIPETVEFREIVLSARSGDVDTKSSRDENGTFYWSPSDTISLFRGEGRDGGWALVSTNKESAVSAVFTGKVPADILDNPVGDDFWAVYPFNNANSFNGGFISTVVPADQVAAEGTFADRQFISVGRCSADELSMSFYHLCGGIKFTVQNPYKSITLRGNDNEILAGTVDVEFDGKAPVVIGEVRDPSTEITISCPDGASFIPGVEYFIVTLPVKFDNGFTVSFDNGFERVIDTPLVINRAKFQWSKYPIDYTGEWIYETCNIENEGVRRFIESVEYEDGGYNDSQVVTYYRNFKATDKPLPVSFTWEGDASQIVISTDERFEEVVLEQDVSSSVSHSLDVYNLIPGIKYYYKVSDQNGTVLKRACMTPEGPVRMIYGVTRNMRDLGGWPTVKIAAEDGGIKSFFTKYGKVYRGFNINDITEEGRKILLEDLGVTLELDLRGIDYKANGSSVDKPVDVLNGQVQYVNLSPRMYMYYRGQGGVTEELYRKALRVIISELQNDGVVFFHCYAGADRTGTLAFLIEALMGVSESDMSKDFEMTTFSGSERRRNVDSSNGGYPFKELIKYLRDSFGYVSSMQEVVENWATTGENALTYDEISALKYLLMDSD